MDAAWARCPKECAAVFGFVPTAGLIWPSGKMTSDVGSELQDSLDFLKIHPKILRLWKWRTFLSKDKIRFTVHVKFFRGRCRLQGLKIVDVVRSWDVLGTPTFKHFQAFEEEVLKSPHGKNLSTKVNLKIATDLDLKCTVWGLALAPWSSCSVLMLPKPRGKCQARLGWVSHVRRWFSQPLVVGTSKFPVFFNQDHQAPYWNLGHDYVIWCNKNLDLLDNTS